MLPPTPLDITLPLASIETTPNAARMEARDLSPFLNPPDIRRITTYALDRAAQQEQ